MATAKALGFDTVRTFLAAMPGVFSYPNPTEDELNNLTDFCARAKAAGVKLHLTLFDQWSTFGDVAGSKTWASAVIGALDLANQGCIEVKNEVKFANPQIGQAALAWALQMIPYIRTRAPGVPVIISTTTDFTISPNPCADLLAFVTGVKKNPQAAPDWYDQHIYTGTTPGRIYGYLSTQ